MVPFHGMTCSVGAHDTVNFRDSMPVHGIRRSGPANALHVDGQSIAMQRHKFVVKAPDPEPWRSIGGENSCSWQPASARLPYRIGQPNDEFGVKPGYGNFSSLA